MRKLLLLFLLIILPLAANAAVEIDGVMYNISENREAEVVSNQNYYSGHVDIPPYFTYEGVNYSVTSIGEYAFQRCWDLTSVTIPNSVTSIGKFAFDGCWSLTSVTIPNSVTSIGDYAFAGCRGLTSVTIPNSVTSIGSGAFYRCSRLTSITIPNSVTSIGHGAFEGCGLTSITIPNSMTSISNRIFCDCTNLVSVTIPNSVTSIGYDAFNNCSSLTTISIPKTVTSIGHGAFSGCKSLTSITIPNSVTNIENGAFAYCSGLTSITIPNSVTSIVDDAFSYCSGLTCITIPNSVISIGDDAFSGCSRLTSVTIPNSVTSIGESAFSGCTGLTSVTIPNGVTSIGSSSFEGCNSLTSITIPNSVTSIGKDAFSYCSSLTFATIGNSVTSVENYAFMYCSNLSSVTIGNSVTSIGEGAFMYCSGLISITIPNSVTIIDRYAFSHCSGLTDFVCLATEVPSTDTSVFSSVELKNVILHVPEESIDKYAAVEPWNKFKSIVAIEGNNVSPVELNMSATEENGLVRLKFNVVPDEISYRITRTDINGVQFDYNDQVRHDSGNLEYVDYPPAAGTYTYSLMMAYYDENGEKQVAKSNTLTVTVSEPLDEEKAALEYGMITGRIECDKYPPVRGLKVKFSDNDVTVNARGTIFSRQRIPVGTKVTMTVLGDESHEYESATATIQPGLNTVTIHGTLKKDYTPNEGEYDLQKSSDMQFYVEDGKHHLRFTIVNPNEEYAWVGSVIAELVQQNHLTYFDTWKDILNGEKPVFRGEVSDIRILNKKPQEIDIVFDDMELRRDTEFKLYLISKGRWDRSGIQEEITEKTIVTMSGWKLAGEEVLINKTHPNKWDSWNREAKEDFSYLMMGLSSLTPGMDGVFGDFSSYQYKDKMMEFAQLYTGERDKFEAVKVFFEYVNEWVGGKTALETLNEIGPANRIYNGSSTIKDIVMELKNIFLPEKSILQKFRKDMIVNIDDIHYANAMMGNVVSAFNAAKSVQFGSTLEQVMTCASTLYGLTADTYLPLKSMMYTYMEAGQTLVNAAKQLQQVMHDAELPDRLIANDSRLNVKNGLHESGDPSYNTTCDFKLMVKNSWGIKINFQKEKRNKQIKDITISASNDPEKLYVATYHFDMQYLNDGIMLKLKRYDTLFPWGVKPMTDKEKGGGSNLTQFYMTIYWANDRITIIPLNQETNGVDIKCGTLRTGDFKGEDLKPSLYSVTLATKSGMDNMADDIYLGSNKDRE